jgi:hypothetical protein|tara:strand:+ start:1091 stop:1714 length:624 start_codon:yes stop_codon:yes gene_type:complete
MSKTENNYFKDLVATDVTKHVKKKGNFNYLSWAIAWNYLKQEDENAQRIVYEAPETGLNWFSDGMTGYVKVGIVIKNIEHIDYLPIKDFRHKSLTVDKITSMDVNTAIQRSTAKAIAMHGLGLNLYANEDTLIIPEFEESKKIATTTKEKTQTLITLDIGDMNWSKVLTYVSKNKTLGLEEITERLKAKYNIKATVKKELAKSLKDE